MDDSKVFMFPDKGNGGIDAATAMLLANGNGFNNNPMWMMFMWPFIMPFMSMFGGWGNGFGGFGGNNGGGAGYIANQLNNDAGRDLIVQAINGRADALGQLAQITHSDVNSVRDNLAIMNTKLSEVGGQIGISGLQVINEVQSGNAAIAKQLCECCCENRLATCQQTNTLSSQAAANFAATQLQLAQNEAADQLSVCKQTNEILGAIESSKTLITKEFCELKERELQNKIDSLTADNALLRSNANNMMQTQQFAAMLAPINAELASIKAAQPSTITLPNTQYAVVPSWYANGSVDFVASYWANRLSNATAPAATAPATASTNA
jgi:hypothetical protein